MQTILKESINQNALDNEWKNIHKTFIFLRNINVLYYHCMKAL